MKKIVVIVGVLLIVGAASWYGFIKALDRDHTLFSKEKISQIIQQKYGGTIKKIQLIPEKETYELTLVQKEIPYHVKVNGHNGEVLSFTKQNPLDQKIENQRKEKQMEPSQKDMTPNTPITEEQAKKLASEKVTGTITSIELDDEDDQLVYEIEIEQSQTKEATVIVNSYSGKIESITFETEDDLDEDDD